MPYIDPYKHGQVIKPLSVKTDFLSKLSKIRFYCILKRFVESAYLWAPHDYNPQFVWGVDILINNETHPTLCNLTNYFQTLLIACLLEFLQRFLKFSMLKYNFNLQNPMVITCTTHFSILKFYFLPTEYICVFRMVLTINSVYFPKQH
jgi:hypothetical protein